MALLERCVVAAADAGLQQILEGHGGDETLSFAGYGRLHELARQQSWGALSKELSALARREGINAMAAFEGFFGKYGKGRLAGVWRRIRPARRSRKGSVAESSWLAVHWREDTAVQARHRPLQKWDPAGFGTERSHHESVLASPFQPFAFETHSKLLRAYGLEARFPFWDQDVVELSLRLPASQKLRRGQTRDALRSAMRGVLPEIVRLRSDKLDFSGHLVRGILQDRPTVLDTLGLRSAECFDYLDFDTVAEGVRDLESEDRLRRGPAAQGVLAAMTLELWLRSLRGSRHLARAPLETSA
jgi:asparagine synthase (glutamine-hydrolysing)